MRATVRAATHTLGRASPVAHRRSLSDASRCRPSPRRPLTSSGLTRRAGLAEVFEGGGWSTNTSELPHFSFSLEAWRGFSSPSILTIVVQPPRTPDALRKNPLGVFVNALNWSKELSQ